ncbi:MAG: PilZ domain-containing protein [Candidatus Competibacter sp.]|nr:PilZ domain-containing protein [Candidatus Competibacter sp.]MDG4583963.1 PilZ domain-containing protein [Candidatus Competibacter sp.]
MRQFIRHPSDIPITYSITHLGNCRKNCLRDIGQGGLCFSADAAVERGCLIRIVIPIREPEFEVTGTIVWCRKTNGHFDVGVRFEDLNTAFSVRMIEQICHINHYRKEVLEKEGRQLSGAEAAAEWVAKFARDFPG